MPERRLIRRKPGTGVARTSRTGPERRSPGREATWATEQRIDLGVIGDRTFVNNASFGAYAEVVRSPAYRDDKRGN